MPNSDRPNLLVIMSDQRNRRVAGCYGDDLIRTPNTEGLHQRRPGRPVRRVRGVPASAQRLRLRGARLS